MIQTPLWPDADATRWTATFARYDEVIAEQGVASLADHEQWYATELPAAIAARTPPFVSHAELARITAWKMARGVWRARNLALVKGNEANDVESVSREALGLAVQPDPHPTKPIARLATLAGVGPATASAVVSVVAPAMYPFFDEVVAVQVPGLGPVKFTLGYYAAYASALRERATALGAPWTASRVERALWAHVGGKAALGD